MRKDITLLLVLDGKAIDQDQKKYYNQITDTFAKVIGVVKEGTGADWIQEKFADFISYSSEQGKVDALNRAIKKVDSPSVIYLECDERLSISKMPESVEPDTCYRALIEGEIGEELQQNYQIRLFPASDNTEEVLNGFAIPDCNQRFQALQWKLSEHLISIHKSGPLFKIADAEAERESSKSNAISFLWKALLETKKQRYQRAEDHFRQAVKHENLFEFDYLAALNGLANVLVEQHKLAEAVQVAEQSLAVSKHQRAPYLTLYRVSELSGRPEEAYRWLTQYLDVFSYGSRANMDIRLSRRECHYLMADTTFRQGDYTRAFQHYESFYELNDGEVSQSILEKLFIYAIELKNYEKSVQYFNDMFDAHIPDNINDDRSARLLESLSLFMDNEWYEFVGSIYEKLVNHNPKDHQLLNRWITTLIKTKQVDKAQALLARRKAS